MRRFGFIAMGIFGLLTLDVQARSGTVRTLDGIVHEGNVILSPIGGLLVTLADGRTALVPVANIANAKFDSPANGFTNATYRYIVFRNGSVLPARIERATAEGLTLESFGKKLTVSILDVAGILNQPGNPNQIPAFANGRLGALLRTGDFIDGEFSGGDNSRVSISTILFGPRRLDWDKDCKAVILRALPENASRYYVRLANGITLASKAAPGIGAGDGLVVLDSILGESRVQFNEILEIRTPPR